MIEQNEARIDIFYDGFFHFVIRKMFSFDEIELHSKWISSGNAVVEVINKNEGLIEYSNENGDVFEKDLFSFQCRYCLLVEDLLKFKKKFGEYRIVRNYEE